MFLTKLHTNRVTDRAAKTNTLPWRGIQCDF